jgi:hypothetical protein
MKTGSVETSRPVLHLNSSWKKLQFAACDDFRVFPNWQNEIRNVLMLVQKCLQFWQRDARVQEVVNSHTREVVEAGLKS